MTNEQKKRQLQKYRELENEVRRLTGEIERWRQQSSRTTSVVSSLPKVSGGDCRQLEHSVISIIDLTQMLERRQNELIKLRLKLMNAIEEVNDYRQRLILQYKYIDGLTFEKIAAELDLQCRWTIELHNRALSAIRTL